MSGLTRPTTAVTSEFFYTKLTQTSVISSFFTEKIKLKNCELSVFRYFYFRYFGIFTTFFLTPHHITCTAVRALLRNNILFLLGDTGLKVNVLLW